MAIVVTANVGIGTGVTGVTISGVTAGNALILFIPYLINSGNGSAVPTVADTQGTWTTDSGPTPAGSSPSGWTGVALYSQLNCAAGTHTLAFTLAGQLNISYVFAEVSGLQLSSAFDTPVASTPTTLATGASPLVVASPSNTAQPVEIEFACGLVQTNSGASAAMTDPPTGFTSLGVRNALQGSGWGFEAAYRIVSATEIPGASWAFTAAAPTYRQAIIGAYKGVTSVISSPDGMGGGLDGGLTGGFS